ncbi:unnamed protein product, partial [Iphiclides podalirius]
MPGARNVELHHDDLGVDLARNQNNNATSESNAPSERIITVSQTRIDHNSIGGRIEPLRNSRTKAKPPGPPSRWAADDAPR